MMESYSCESCSVKFVSQLKLKKHIKRIHDNRVFVCEYCNNEIIGQTKLSNHLKIHKSRPGETTPTAFQSYTVHATPRGQEWRLPLLVSLLEMRDSRWEVNFDEETQKVNKEEIEAMIENVCIGE